MEVFHEGRAACRYDLHRIKCLMKSSGAVFVSASIALFNDSLSVEGPQIRQSISKTRHWN